MSEIFWTLLALLALTAGFTVVYFMMKLGERHGNGGASAISGSLELPGRFILWLLAVWPPNVRVLLASALALAALFVAHTDLHEWGASFWGFWLVVSLVMTLLAGFAAAERRKQQAALLAKVTHARRSLDSMVRRTRFVVVTMPLLTLAAGYVLFAFRAIPR